MSTAIDFAPHNFGHTMLGAMSRPLNGWHEPPYAPRHSRDDYYAQDRVNSGGRLPGPASLLSGPPPPPLSSNMAGREHNTAYSSKSSSTYYSDYATPSPIGQSPRLSLSSSDPPPVAPSRRPMPGDLRRSPTLSSPVSERSDDFQEIMRAHHPLRQMATQARQHLLPEQGPSHVIRRDVDSRVSQQPFPTSNGGASYVSHSASPPATYMPSPREEHKPSMKISSLLSDERPENTSNSKAPIPSPIPQTSSAHKIHVRQQPAAARSCGFGERDRRVIDPPPIVQLTIEDPEASPEEIKQRTKAVTSAVVHCSIWDETGTVDMSAMPEDFRQQRRLMGTLVASPFIGMDENGEEGCFFCFPDLSCRTPGSYRLKFSFVNLQPKIMRPGMKLPIQSTTMSDSFTVYNAKDFPGMQASTPLTKKLKEQGCLISIKKGNDKASGGTRARDDSDDDDDDDAGSTGGGRKKRARNQ